MILSVRTGAPGRAFLPGRLHVRRVWLMMLAALCSAVGWPGSVRAISSADADAAFTAFNQAFYVVSNGKGYYKVDSTASSGKADFWKQAEMIEMIIDVYQRTTNPTHKTMISQSIDGFMANYGSDWLWNGYNDDIMWMVIACCRGYTATGNTTYRDRAKYHFDAVYNRGWDTALGGGIWWTTNKGEKNACINGPAAIAACLLYQIYGDAAYLEKARAIYAWEKATLFDPNTGKVYDNINSSGVVNSSWIFTYNEGTFIGAGHLLNRLTGESAYYTDALKAALYAKNSMSTTEILPEYGDTGDGGGFTGIFARWLGRFVSDNNLWGTFYVWMAENANAAWNVRRADKLSWCKWRSVTPEGTLTSFGCSPSVAMMQVVPTDYGLPALNYQPVTLTPGSYNKDVVVEAAAPRGGPVVGATTATMDGGTANTGSTWYEIGYLTNGPLTGLPPAGSTFTHALYPSRTYAMPPSYAANNAAFLSSAVPNVALTPASPSAVSALSFLTASGNGPVTVRYTIRHQDGSTQAGTFSSPNWYNGLPMAYVANGRLSLSDGTASALAANNPRLYAAEVTVNNTGSAVTNIALSFGGGSGTASAVVLAVSAVPGSVAPQIGRGPVSTKCWEGTNVLLSAVAVGTAPLSCQWQKRLGSTFVNLVNGANVTGVTTTSLSLTPSGTGDAGEYRLVASNPAGAATSSVAVVTILSAMPDVTQPGDPVTSFGGTSPTGEGVAQVIGNTTSKYLNFGLNGGSGLFAGPVGFVVTPTIGRSVVKYLRFYTGNDEPGRDPAAYALYGSNDGGNTYTLVGSGALSLPAERNVGGMALNAVSQFVQQVELSNAKTYTTYKVSFNTVKTASAGMMQIGEVELLGAAVPTLTILADEVSPGTVTIGSSAPGRLWSTAVLAGTNTVWRDEGPISASVTLTPSAADAARFYRVSTW